jgi:hypothetical protein
MSPMPRVKRIVGIAADIAAAQETQTLHDVITKLRHENSKLLRRLEDAHTSKRELVDAVYRAAREAADAIDVPAVRPPVRDRRISEPETAILIMSDWQLAKKTPTYNTDICAKRVDEYVAKVMHLTDIQRADRPIRKAVLCLAGDLVEGEQIFPGQYHRIDGSLFRQVMLDGPQILASAVTKLLGYFDEVVVEEVAGNHGRIGRRGEFHPETNADSMLYHATRLLIGKNNKRLTWNMNYQPGENAWYKVFAIGRHNYFLFHGHQMRGGGFAGIPIYGFIRAMHSWAAGAIPESFRYAICGHWHSSWSIPFGQNHSDEARILWVNGSTESGNEWLREEIKNQTPPSQWLLFGHDMNGVTSEHRVWLK